MKRTLSLSVSIAALFAATTASAEEARFDAQLFRPSAAPRDLVMVQKSEVVGHLSPVFGVYTDIALDPLTLLAINSGKSIDAVGARFQVTGLASVGFYDWFDVGLAIPFVAWQTSDNLRSLGSEGEISPQAMGDIRLSTKIALPYFNRKARIKEGLGMAVAGNINLPTGNQNAFASDGAFTGGASYIVDYRFNFGLLISANAGVWFRPDRQFAGTKIGDMASWGTAAEMYVVQRWGWSVLGGVYGHVSLTKFPDSAAQVPAEALLAMRWQWKSGFTLTVGGNFGANCGFGAPMFRAFAGLNWTPSSSREQEEVNRLKQKDSNDPDHDGLIEKADRCPDDPGTPQNFGCPDQDRDSDGIVDREDECPELASGFRGQKGCPVAYIKGDEITILDQVNFATDKDIILDDSKPVLDQVVQVLSSRPDIREVVIEGHTDVRANDKYNMGLSQRRVDSVKQYLVDHGIESERLNAVGMGHSKPMVDDSGCIGSDDKLSDTCKYLTSKNRRVIFRIKRIGAAPPKGIGGGSGSNLPTTAPVLGTEGVLKPGNGVLNGSNLPGTGSALPTGGSALPTKGGVLPGSVLQRSGTPAPQPQPEPEKAPQEQPQEQPQKQPQK
ncbi:OmpA family protein [Polyangium aurulentum]|uniref:OmpA family protein n=1 Tax=Polyangium aurulentum TaxID=2567896 RepID=UPI0010AE22BA|nr:OmpA family protein [Polyangium aurulentum]UQA57538.1 OmpA family protein [Polyangium aurulentum]